jgi:hypothetical protein
MNETSVTQEHKRPVSKLAKISLVFSIAGFACVLPGSYLMYLELHKHPAAIFLTLALIFFGLGFIFAIAALLAIPLSKHIAKTRTAWMIMAAIVICLVSGGLFMPAMGLIRPIQRCEYNCEQIRHKIMRYAGDHNGKPLSLQNWCDALTSEEYFNKRDLICPGARHKGDKGLRNYAINPDCEPNSPNDVVFLFETKGGWNQYGGPELISFDNHVRKGANVIFNNGRVEFIKPGDVGKLKWKAEANEMNQPASR